MKLIKNPPVNVPKTFWRALITAMLAFPQILFFEGIYNLFSVFIFRPVFGFVVQLMITVRGYNLAFNEKIWASLLNLPGILCAVLLSIIAGILIYYEFSVISLLLYRRYQKKPIHLSEAMKLAVPSMKSLCSPGIIGFSLYSVAILPLANLILVPSLTGVLEIPKFVTGELYKTFLGLVGVLLIKLLIYGMYLLLIYVLPSMTLGRGSFGTSVRKSVSFLKNGGIVPLLPLGVLIGLWILLFVKPGVFPTAYPGISDVGVMGVIGELFSSETFVPLMLVLLSRILQWLILSIFLAYLTIFYARVDGRVELLEEAIPTIDRYLKQTKSQAGRMLVRGFSGLRQLWGTIKEHPFYRTHRRKLMAIAGIFILVAAFSFFRTPPVLHEPIVIGHRGSTAGVENTLPAIQGAIDSGADYAEIDIQLSKDNVPMVCHDANLKRLSGEEVNLYDLTAEELSTLTLSQNGYTAKIPTLEEVIEYCDGKIGLAIEFKPNGHEKGDLVRETMALLEEKNFEKQCLLLSLDYDLIERVQKEYPQFTAGYCIYGNLGNIGTRKLVQLNVDFLFVEEGMVSAKFVEQCRKAWMPVYVWTVNDSQKMEDYLDAGVLGIISDHPWDAVYTLKTYQGITVEETEYYQEENEYTFPEE